VPESFDVLGASVDDEVEVIFGRCFAQCFAEAVGFVWVAYDVHSSAVWAQELPDSSSCVMEVVVMAVLGG
jgi:hypothetical protein